MNKPLVYLVPDAASLIELYTQRQLGLLIHSAWSLMVPDAVMHVLAHAGEGPAREVMRWVVEQNIPVLDTQTFSTYLKSGGESSPQSRSHGANCALQELLAVLGSQKSTIQCLLLTHENRCHNPAWWVPGNCLRIVPRALSKFVQVCPPPPRSHIAPKQAEIPSAIQCNAKPIGRMPAVRIPALFNARQLERLVFEVLTTVGEQLGKVLQGIKTQWANRQSQRLGVAPEKDLIDTFRRNLH